MPLLNKFQLLTYHINRKSEYKYTKIDYFEPYCHDFMNKFLLVMDFTSWKNNEFKYHVNNWSSSYWEEELENINQLFAKFMKRADIFIF